MLPKFQSSIKATHTAEVARLHTLTEKTESGRRSEKSEAEKHTNQLQLALTSTHSDQLPISCCCCTICGICLQACLAKWLKLVEDDHVCGHHLLQCWVGLQLHWPLAGCSWNSSALSSSKVRLTKVTAVVYLSPLFSMWLSTAAAAATNL